MKNKNLSRKLLFTATSLLTVAAGAADNPFEDNLLGDWGGSRSRLADKGIDFSLEYISEVAGNVSGGSRRGAVYQGLLSFGADLDLEKAVHWKGGTFHAGMNYSHGSSLSAKYVNDMYLLSNIDASDNVRLVDLWLERAFADGKFSIRAGKILIDEEFAAPELGSLFNSSAFGWFPIVGAPAPVFPQGSYGVRLKYQPTENAYVQAAIVDGDGNPANALGEETNPHGLNFKFNEGALIFTETGCKWAFANETKPGRAFLGGWYHTANTPHNRFDTIGLSLADPASTGIPATISDNWGIYLGGDQMLWKEDSSDKESTQGIGVFSRFGYEPSDRNGIGLYFEGGIVDTGLIPGRDDDQIGVGIAYGRVATDLRRLGRDANFFGGTTTPLPDYEMVIEGDYQFVVGKGVTVQPGLQYIVHPGGSSAVQDALVLTLRAVFTF